MRTSSQDGGVGEHSSPPHTTTAKITTNLQNNYHLELSENQAVWKSNNQGIKEITFIQIDRRGGDAEKQRCGTAILCPHVVDKNWDTSL